MQAAESKAARAGDIIRLAPDPGIIRQLMRDTVTERVQLRQGAVGNPVINTKGNDLMEPILGMIYMFAGNFAPEGYAMCDGQLLGIAQNQALFAIIGTTYGGDGRQNFALPKLMGPDGTKYIIAIRGIFPSRQ